METDGSYLDSDCRSAHLYSIEHIILPLQTAPRCPGDACIALACLSLFGVGIAQGVFVSMPSPPFLFLVRSFRRLPFLVKSAKRCLLSTVSVAYCQTRRNGGQHADHSHALAPIQNSTSSILPLGDNVESPHAHSSSQLQRV